MIRELRHQTVVEAIWNRGGCASMKDIENLMYQHLKGPYHSDLGFMYLEDRTAIMRLKIDEILDDLRRNGLVEMIDEDLFALTDAS
ncbi:MAG: hypothetical protein QCI82_03485 [Candidatus Thermoplasmatota archaeon]|nr:hypothetical protein [Candidatus Thermoplasmatota archaeon]